MSRVALTGGDGFLGWHTWAALREAGAAVEQIPVGGFLDADQARRAVSGADRVIHLAGVNRGDDDEVLSGNILFAEQLAAALRAADAPPEVVVYANSIQSGNASPYGQGKARAAAILAEAASRVGAEFLEIQFPNLFGEHGRPFYNAVTATFSHLLAEGGRPTVVDDKELTLLHAQNAADLLIGARPVADQAQLEEHETVSGLLRRLEGFAELCRLGQIPDVARPFDRDLFNTYRSHTFPAQAPVRLTRHSDARGSFFEIVRSHGGPGQSSFSTTAPGVTRGDHFHRRKIERFTVLAGQARISLRRFLGDDVVSFDVTGDEPAAVDMPTMWAHNITNTGAGDLYTSFWTDDLFDPARPDTIPEAV
ncbi:MAG: NAD-dependent epimerase/dehydratase family protein [Propionibacteriaceae bacterium]|nr:NAD-dependent epimerase/dehydratase family protein [Propionibacteriaceae bacterium]